jgi:hypothetical protein
VSATRTRRSRFVAAAAAGVVIGAIASSARGFDYRFDVTTFYESPEFSLNHLRQAHFDRLNWSSPNGHQLMMGTDAHRSELTTAGNVLGVYHNSLTQVYTDSAHDPVVAANMFRSYAVTNHGNTGAVPQWISLNEISSSLWQNSPEYREWLKATVARLHDTYGHEVIVFSPFSNPLNPDRAPDWQAIAAKAYIGVENFLSGEEVRNAGYSLSWAQDQYKVSLDSYTSKGVDPSRLMLLEYFAHTVAGTGYGRAGVPIDEWVRTINLRSDAIRNVGFAGFIGYAWSKNNMLVSDAEMYQAIEAYRSHIVVESEGAQWNKDANGAWITGANWTSPFAPVPPGGVGDVANFVKPLTAGRTVSIDGPITIGRMTFRSASSYTLASGIAGGGTLTLANNGQPGSITVSQGSHFIAAPLVLSDAVNLKIAATGLSIAGPLDNSAGKTITKSGAGQLNISGAQTHGPGAMFIADGGVTSFNSNGGANLAVNARATVNFNATQRLGALTIASGVKVTLSPGGAKTLSLAALTNSGTLDLGDNDLIIRGGGAAIAGTWNGSAYTGVTGQVQSAYNAGAWNGPGIATTRNEAKTGLTTLAVALAGNVLSISGSQTTIWNGQTVGASDVLVMYTYGGDANLDGFISGDDYSAIDFHVGTSAAAYYNGDFNYDGIISGDDYSTIDFNFAAQGAPLDSSGSATATGVTSVPEPTTAIALLSAGFASLISRRRQNRRC